MYFDAVRLPGVIAFYPMRTVNLLKHNLAHYWRTNLAVIAGVGIAIAVLAGALLVGDSVRASLRDLFLARLGKTEYLISGATFFREALADDLESDGRFTTVFAPPCPLIVLNGLVTHEKSGRRASHVQVYGVDARFWRFHGPEAAPPGDREIILSPDLAREFGAGSGESLLLRIEKPSAIPAGSLHGRKEDLGRTIRLTSGGPRALGDFSLMPQQGPVRAVFVSLRRLQKDLELASRVNTLLLRRNAPMIEAAAGERLLGSILKDRFAIEDLGVKLRLLNDRGCVSLESDTAIISDSAAETARAVAARLGFDTSGVLTYLANTIRSGEREIPYSIVTALDETGYHKLAPLLHPSEDGIVLNDWAAGDLGVKAGDPIVLEYYEWEDSGRLITRSAQFKLDGIISLNDKTADRDLAPDYPGITETTSLSGWDPPFPIDLKRVRPRDDAYWRQYRTAPKAFVPIERGQKLWGSRHGKLTSIRLFPEASAGLQDALQAYKRELRAEIDPAESGLSARSVLIGGLQASQGATDFGEYFVYFSFFLVVSSLLLASLFFKLGIEQRVREIGLLRALGFPTSKIRILFLSEGVALAMAGSVLGMFGSVAYAELVMVGLRTWWVGAVGTTALSMHLSPGSLGLGGAGGVLAAVLCVIWTLRALSRSSPRSLLAGNLDAERDRSHEQTATGKPRTAKRLGLAAMVLATAALLLMLLSFLKIIGQTEGFFGAGSLLLASLLCWEAVWLSSKGGAPIKGAGWLSIIRVGFRNTTHRPGRSLLCITLIASAVFIVVAVDAFRRDRDTDTLNKKSGGGGFPLLAQSMLPLYHDPNTTEGREALNLSSRKDFKPDDVKFFSFRVREGDDASCLNLYQPRNPRILAPSSDFIKSGRFSFQDSLAADDGERDNPWLLLEKNFGGDIVPAIADANSMTYVLHHKLGDDLVLDLGGKTVRLRLAAALSDSLFQSELLISERNFLALFPDNGGFGFFLLETPPGRVTGATEALEEELSDFGFDVTSSAERLAAFHKVENTYLSTFQALGGLGLMLGTFGLAAVLLRNVLERRKELAVLRAVGYRSAHFRVLVLSENAFLVVSGLLIGALSALVAVAPALLSRGGRVSAASMGALFLAVLAAGLIASVLATKAALGSPLLAALRAE